MCVQHPLTHETVALRSGLVWPTAPYRTLGDAYLKALRKQLRRNAQWKYPIQWPSERFNQLASRDGRRHVLQTPLGGGWSRCVR